MPGALPPDPRDEDRARKAESMTIKRVLSSTTYRVAGGAGGGTHPAREIREIHQEDFYRTVELLP